MEKTKGAANANAAGRSVAKGGKRPRRMLLYVAATLAAFYSFWPIMIMALEGYNIDLGAFFAGKAISISIGGLSFAPRAIIPTAFYYLQALSIEAYPRLEIG